MPIISLTNRFLSTIKAQTKIVVYYDKNIKGMMLRVHPTGQKSFYSVLKVNGVRTFRFIGTYPTLKPETVKQIVQSHFLESLNITTPTLQNKVATSKTFKTCLDLYLEERKHDFKDKTKKVYTSILNAHILPAFQHIPISLVTHNDIINLRNGMVRKQTTYNSCHRFLSAFFNYCVIQDILKINPIKNVKKYKDNIRTGHFSNSQYHDFIKSTYTLLDECKISLSSGSCILFLLLTGCRLSEALTCKWSYYDNNSTMMLPDSKTGAKTLYIGEKLKTLLSFLPKNNDYIFTGRYGKDHIVSIIKPFKLILLHANIKEHFTLHHLRHSYISIAANAGMPLNAVQVTVGHKSQSTTERYTHTNQKLAESTAQKIENIITTESEHTISQIIHSLRS